MVDLHIEESLLEQYAMDALAEPSVAEIEEHLLACPECQSRLVMLDRFVSAFRGVVVEAHTEAVERYGRSWSLLQPLWAASALCLAASLILLVSGRPNTRSMLPAVVLMQTFRGPAGTHVSAGKPVQLVFDLGANAPAGSTRYEVEFVDLAGRKILNLKTAAEGPKLTMSPGSLRAGSYWVRVYQELPERRLLQEYLLRAE